MAFLSLKSDSPAQICPFRGPAIRMIVVFGTEHLLLSFAFDRSFFWPHSVASEPRPEEFPSLGPTGVAVLSAAPLLLFSPPSRIGHTSSTSVTTEVSADRQRCRFHQWLAGELEVARKTSPGRSLNATNNRYVNAELLPLNPPLIRVSRASTATASCRNPGTRRTFLFAGRRSKARTGNHRRPRRQSLRRKGRRTGSAD
jgi:hypothetical protein